VVAVPPANLVHTPVSPTLAFGCRGGARRSCFDSPVRRARETCDGLRRWIPNRLRALRECDPTGDAGCRVPQPQSPRRLLRACRPHTNPRSDAYRCKRSSPAWCPSVDASPRSKPSRLNVVWHCLRQWWRSLRANVEVGRHRRIEPVAIGNRSLSAR
jgi:hypothetical protein